MPAKQRQLQQSNLDSCINALGNAYSRLERFRLIYEKRYPDTGEFAAVIMDKIKGAFVQVQVLRDSI